MYPLSYQKQKKRTKVLNSDFASHKQLNALSMTWGYAMAPPVVCDINEVQKPVPTRAFWHQ